MSTTTTLINNAPANHNTGTVVTAVRQVPANFDKVQVTITCTTGNPAAPFTGFAHPFNDPINQSTTFGVLWSWDGGATFPSSDQNSEAGSATGVWATDRQGNPIMTPEVTLTGLPFNVALGGVPNAYRAYQTVAGGPITFGITVNETLG